MDTIPSRRPRSCQPRPLEIIEKQNKKKSASILTFCRNLTWQYMGVSNNRGKTPKMDGFLRENTIKMDDLGVQPFSETPTWGKCIPTTVEVLVVEPTPIFEKHNIRQNGFIFPKGSGVKIPPPRYPRVNYHMGPTIHGKFLQHHRLSRWWIN